jgi:CspA family cold shock protein
MVIMNPIPKNIILSLFVGTLAYFFSQFVSSSLHLPGGPEWAVLTSYILAVFLGCSLSASIPRQSSGRSANKPARKPEKQAAKKPASSNSAKESGTVKWFNVKKGFGFITRDGGEDIFVHYRNIEGNGRRAIAEGQRVQFVVIDGDKGLQADEVEAL